MKALVFKIVNSLTGLSLTEINVQLTAELIVNLPSTDKYVLILSLIRLTCMAFSCCANSVVY